MKYTSTRDATKLYTFEEALFSGYAPDGGLFVPMELPDLFGTSSSSDANANATARKTEILTDVWPKLRYADLATEILHPFVGGGGGGGDDDDGIPREELRRLLGRCLEGFDRSNDPVPVVPLVRKNGDDPTAPVDCYVAELFHGPTYCFKDLGMRATVFLLEYFAGRSASVRGASRKKVVLTAATTGDTGPAAVRAVRDLDSPNLGIVVHYPEGQISDFQRKQMTTVASDRVEIVSFDGGGDDMDRPIKTIMTTQRRPEPPDADSGNNIVNNIVNNNSSNNNNNLRDDILVCGVNSYNIGRPLMQMVHFVWTYLRVVEQIEATTRRKIDHAAFRLDVVIPTGAMGNIAGCYMAKKLGVPFGRLCAGVNVNDVTHRAFSTGRVRKPRGDEPMKASLSDAINIQLPYNLERLLFYLTDQDHDRVRAWYEDLEGAAGGIDLATTTEEDGGGDAAPTGSWLDRLRTEFRSARVTDDELCATIRRVLDAYGYWVDPHTGVAVSAAEQLGMLHGGGRDPATTSAVAVMATASPCKFRSAMTAAVGPERWKDYELHHFPARGRDLMGKKETQPTRYLADPGKTLEENQLVWEARTRELIAKVGR